MTLARDVSGKLTMRPEIKQMWRFKEMETANAENLSRSLTVKIRMVCG